MGFGFSWSVHFIGHACGLAGINPPTSIGGLGIFEFNKRRIKFHRIFTR
jgi:hypothetical protein